MDAKFNYLIGDCYEKFPNDFKVDKRNDPDSNCEKLYDDLKQAFFSDKKANKCYGINNVNNKKQQYDKNKPPFFTLFINDNEFRLSSDYIGPSIYWSKQFGKKDGEIIEFIKKARTIGGHILWPRGFSPTINQAKGGEKGFYDRIDWTLALIKIFYCFSEKEKFIAQCKMLLPIDVCESNQNTDRFNLMYSALSCSEEWLGKFGRFNEFCDYFKLTGSFVTERYKIIELAPFFPILPSDFDKYINNNIKAIDLRSYAIVQPGK